MIMKKKGIFSAIVLITIGVLCLLHIYEIVHFSWWTAIKLWPLLLIWIGVKCIPIEEPWKLILKIIVLLFGIFLLFYLSNTPFSCCKSWGYHNKSECEKEYVIEIENDEMFPTDDCNYEKDNGDETIMDDVVKLNLTAAAGKLTFEPGNSLFSIESNRNSKHISTKIIKKIINKKTNITASITPVKNFSINDNPLKYNVLISDKPIWEMKLELNATANEIDFSPFKIKELQLESNASAVNLKFGNLYDNVEVDIQSNASSVSIKLPKDMRCILNRDNTLSSMKVHGFKKQKDGSYLSEDDIEPLGTVHISVNAGVSAVEIRKY
jgi:hypothetical protein